MWVSKRRFESAVSNLQEQLASLRRDERKLGVGRIARVLDVRPGDTFKREPIVACEHTRDHRVVFHFATGAPAIFQNTTFVLINDE